VKEKVCAVCVCVCVCVCARTYVQPISDKPQGMTYTRQTDKNDIGK